MKNQHGTYGLAVIWPSKVMFPPLTLDTPVISVIQPDAESEELSFSVLDHNIIKYDDQFFSSLHFPAIYE